MQFNDVETIVKGLLLSLTAYKTPSQHGSNLLETLLDKVSTSLRPGDRSADYTQLHTTRLYLDLIAFVVVERQIAPALQLLRFYCSYLSSKITLQKFSPEDQTSVICNMIDTLEAASMGAANKTIEPNDDGPQLDVLKRQVMDASPFLLEVRVNYLAGPGVLQPILVPWKNTEQREIRTSVHLVVTVLQTCKWLMCLAT